MTGILAENWENYGGNINLSLNGITAEVDAPAELVIPGFDTLGRYWCFMNGRFAGIRRVFPSGVLTKLGVWTQNYFPNLPFSNNRVFIMETRNVSNILVYRIALTSDGNLRVIALVDDVETIMAGTTAPCVVAGTSQRIQAQFDLTGGTAEVEIRVEGVSVLTASGLAITGSPTQVFFGNSISPFDPATPWYQKAYAVYSLDGTYNDDWPSITGVGTVYPAADTPTAGMTPKPRQMIDAGVLYTQGSGALLDCGALAAYDIGAGDFTLETLYRPAIPPTGSNFSTLLGKWSASNSNRSYRLVKYGPGANGGALAFEITTDGTLATQKTIISATLDVQVGSVYPIAISRTAGVTRLYVNGFQVGAAVADANTYFAAGVNAKFCVGGEMSGTGVTVLANSSVNGMFDATRFTNGVGRYVANYTPTEAPYPTTVGGDPDFADVELLLEYDENLSDQSSFAHTTTARGAAARLLPNDKAFAYETLNSVTPFDDRFLEASLISAAGILTVTANPADTETVTLGAKTYTFKTAISVANDVLIGIDGVASLSNLAAAINQGPGSGTLYGAGTVQNADASAVAGPTQGQMTATAIVPGVVGNTIASTDTLVSGVWTAATLAGGQDIPGPSAFGLTSLDPHVTGLRWLEIRDRSFLNQGAGTLQKSFVVDGNAAAGADNPLNTAPTYRFDVLEEDPDTGAAITPSTILNGQLQFERTS